MFLSRNKKNIMWIPPLICSYGTVHLGFSKILGKLAKYILRVHLKLINEGHQMMLMPCYCDFFLIFSIRAYVVGTHLNCIDKSMQFKWVPKTYAFIKK